MARLIDADAAVKLLRGKCVAKYPLTFCVGLFAAAEEIGELPTLDAVEVKHGRWERKSWWQHKNRYEMDKCSVCGYQVKPKDAHNYCPICGAKMDGDTK